MTDFLDLVTYIICVLYLFIYYTLAEEHSTVFSSLSSPVTGSSVMKLPCMNYIQQNISVVSQPNISVTICSDSHNTFDSSPVTSLSVVEYLTTSSGVVTSISGQAISTITKTTGTYVYLYP